jgi:3-oxoacyl-[acyl-carrier protein] reductase
MAENQRGAVIVSGASRGIGAEVALSLAAQGHAIVVNFCHSERQAQSVLDEIRARGGRAITHGANVSDQQAVREMVARTHKEFGSFAGIVNNAAGLIEPKDFLDLTWDEVQTHIDVQLKGALNLTQAVLPYLLEQKYGVIVNIASIYADVPPPKLLPYSMVKAALLAFSKSLAGEYGPQGLRVNTVSPGMTTTDLIANVPEKIKLVTRMQTPLRRLGTPIDIAGVVAFLFQDEASFITGQNISVSGGMIMQ